jgi:small subunit ribosomal protein S17
MATTSTRSPRRTVKGIVISDKMTKTIAVQTTAKVRHPKYGKFTTRIEVYKAHDEHGKAKTGDTVEIAFARRLSKTKHWRLVRVVSAARVVAVRGEEEIASLPGKQAPKPAAPVAKGATAPAVGEVTS